MEIYRNDISDMLRILPKLETFNPKKTYDLFISTLGFEERSIKPLEQLLKNVGINKTKLLLIEYPTNREENGLNYPFFENASIRMADFKRINYSRKDFLLLLSQILDNFKLPKEAKVIFDLSSCSSYVFYPTMKELINRDIELTLVYTQAKEYRPTKDEWNEILKKANAEKNLFAQSFENAEFQSVGVDGIYSSYLFSEMNPGNRPTKLVAVPNFSVIRMNAIIERDREINKTAYDNIIWLVGDPPSEKNKWRLEALKRTHNLINNKSQNIYSVSTLHYKEMLQTLEDIWLENKHDYHISIGSVGSKMQHVGTFLFSYMHQEVSMWITEPKEFKAERYSFGCENIFQLVFRSVKDLVNSLDQYLSFRWRF